MADDRPRGRVVKDDVLVSLAERERLDPDDLQHLLPAGAVRRFGAGLLEAHAQGAAVAEHPEPGEAPLTAAQQDAVAALRSIAVERAEALGMAPELLARKRSVEACVRHYLKHRELSDEYAGWRRDLVGAAFLARLGRLK